ncbi:Npun_F0494 family protein [Synechocystis sp. LKSZ1]|uniref:Npun_F0494 family protein n=1 Tax=Synechocystis sp. LKSZ1 TaxID=3144951 RepID=UPI00336BECF4
MTSTRADFSLVYSAAARQRAERALRCSPFRLPLLVAMDSQSIPLSAIAGKAGLQQGYVAQALGEGRVEREFMWLIQVGLLRREVDGQGITDQFRLTPLGKQIQSQWQGQGQSWPQPIWWERLQNQLRRWFSFSL